MKSCLLMFFFTICWVLSVEFESTTIISSGFNAMHDVKVLWMLCSSFRVITTILKALLLLIIYSFDGRLDLRKFIESFLSCSNFEFTTPQSISSAAKRNKSDFVPDVILLLRSRESSSEVNLDKPLSWFPNTINGLLKIIENAQPWNESVKTKSESCNACIQFSTFGKM